MCVFNIEEFVALQKAHLEIASVYAGFLYFVNILSHKIKYHPSIKVIMQVILRQVDDCILRRAEPRDLIPIMEINLKTLPEHYSDYFYESLLLEVPEAFIVAEINGKYVGYVMCKTEYGFSNFKKLGFVKKGHVVSIAVLEDFRKRGIGKLLVEESIKGIILKKCDEFYLEVRCSNTDAVRLYEKLGFVIKQQLNMYYRDGEDAFLMVIELGK